MTSWKSFVDDFRRFQGRVVSESAEGVDDSGAFRVDGSIGRLPECSHLQPRGFLALDLNIQTFLRHQVSQEPLDLFTLR